MTLTGESRRKSGTPVSVPGSDDSSVNYREALAWLYGLQRFGIKLGLENIERLLEELSREGALQAVRGNRGILIPGKVIHVAGTNGKGSVCAMIDSIGRARGYLTGLFTSPHLVTFRERIRVNGDMISEQAVANGLTRIRNLVVNWDTHPTFFEVVTALALKYFYDLKVEIVILETGLGGRLDATNAIESNVSVITTIDFDHEKWLGETISEIAAEKAGIIKPGVPVVCATQRPEAENVIRARAATCSSPIQFVTRLYDKTPVALAGLHQKQNAALAVATLRAAKIDVDDSAIASGLASVDWPGRFQRWDERIIIDGAHNPAAAQLVAQTWGEIFAGQQATVILAILVDKNVRDICEALVPISHFILLPKIRSERAANPEELAKTLANISPTLPCSIVPSLADALALARAKPNPILITGSLHFAGEILAFLHGSPAAFEECAQ